MITKILLIVMLPFLGTVIGSGFVFFLKKEMNRQLQRALMGFAAGVMVAASIWSLIIPAMDQSAHMGKLAFLPAFIGVWCGVLFLLALDHFIPHLHVNSQCPEGVQCGLKKHTMLFFAVALHNLPEGMAVGVVAAGWLSGNESISVTAALALAVGIAIQNVPEGAIISMPMRSEGAGRGKRLRLRCVVGSHRACRRRDNHIACGADGACAAVSSCIFRRSHAVCGGGGVNPGDV